METLYEVIHNILKTHFTDAVHEDYSIFTSPLISQHRTALHKAGASSLNIDLHWWQVFNKTGLIVSVLSIR